MPLRTLKWFDSLQRRDFDNGAVIGEIRDVFKACEAAQHEKTLLEECLAIAQSNSANWDALIVATGGNVNDGVQLNMERIVRRCGRTGARQWCPKNALPSMSGYYYVRMHVADKVGMRYFDDSNNTWWLPGRKWSPNDSFSEWLLLDLKQAR